MTPEIEKDNRPTSDPALASASGSVRPAILHIYSAGMQPAENFVDRTGQGRPMRFKCSPLARRQCYGCGKVRAAKNLQVQVFYDSIRHWCKDKTKCKH